MGEQPPPIPYSLDPIWSAPLRVYPGTAANNKYMRELYDPKEESSYLQYLDANNLYGWAMSQSLSTGGFRWVSIEPNEIGELAARTDKGYLLEVDVSYCRELHDSS